MVKLTQWLAYAGNPYKIPLFSVKERNNMRLKTFKGGVHPYDGKALSENCAIRRLESKSKEFIFPLAQHIGSSSRPIVAEGDRVLVGQRIGESRAPISADLCSSVSGTVKVIEPRMTVSGELLESIVITNDGLYETVEGFGVERDVDKLTKDEIRTIIKEAGIVGLGGAGFPTHVKLTPGDDSKIDCIVVNAAECEPYITADYRMLLEESKKVLDGINIVLSLFENAKALIAIEDNKPEAIAFLQKVTNGTKTSVMPLKTKYPQGAERMLIDAATGRRLTHHMLPAEMGCLVINVATAAAISDAVRYSIPLIEKTVTVTGDAITTPSNFRVRIGSSQQEMVEEAGGFSCDVEKLISGGPMMGMAMYTADVPVMKTTSCILAMSYDAVADIEPSNCINCGACVRACPEKLLPLRLMVAADMQRLDDFVRFSGMECIECGSCTYVCPAKRRMTQSFKYCKLAVRNKQKQEAAKNG